MDDDKAVVEFMQEACAALRDFRIKRWKVYASIAGGRKTMSALLTLAVQFYGAQWLFHVLVEDPEIEKGGHISVLRNLPDEYRNRYLHPPVGAIKLVHLPFIGLFPLLNDVVAALKGEDVSAEIRAFLEQNGLWSKGKVTELGRTVGRILEQVESLPAPRPGECAKHLSRKEAKEIQITHRWMERICERFWFVEKIEAIGWREGQPKVKTEAPNKLIVYLPGRRVRGVGLRLFTTAKTTGQLERAKQELERWITRMTG